MAGDNKDSKTPKSVRHYSAFLDDSDEVETVDFADLLPVEEDEETVEDEESEVVEAEDTGEGSIKMVETEEDLELMVEDPPKRNNLTLEEAEHQASGQTHKKFQQVRREKPANMQKYIGPARRY